jgi:DegV family protein with EDD domain
MTVKVVTDSTADLPPEIVKEYGITVVPLYVLFGNDMYRDGVDMTKDQFFERLLKDPVHPSTTQPTPQDFVDIYEKLDPENDGIISIHIARKMSGTCNSADQAVQLMGKEGSIEVIDSQNVSMGLGLIVIAAAESARAGKSLQEIKGEMHQIIPNIRLLALFDTLKYLAKGGRIGKAKSMVGAVLNVKPLLILKEGEFSPFGQVRSRNKGIDQLLDYAKESSNIVDLAIIYSTTPDDAQALADRMDFFKGKARVCPIGSVIGVHGGPAVMGVTFREK